MCIRDRRNLGIQKPGFCRSRKIGVCVQFVIRSFHGSFRVVQDVYKRQVYVDGGIIRTDPSKKQITLVFTAADKADGADAIISTLKKHCLLYTSSPNMATFSPRWDTS